jgi:hypothetical protein
VEFLLIQKNAQPMTICETMVDEAGKSLLDIGTPVPQTLSTLQISENYGIPRLLFNTFWTLQMEDLVVIPLSNCRPISASSLAFFTGSALTGSGLAITCDTCFLPRRRIPVIVAVGFWSNSYHFHCTVGRTKPFDYRHVDYFCTFGSESFLHVR